MEMVRSFLPVGQGAFYTEQFADGTNVIYDCGSENGIRMIEEKCVSLGSYTESTNLSGAILLVNSSGYAPEIILDFAGEKVKTAVKISTFKTRESDTLGISIELDFPEYFEKQMRLAESKQERFERERHNRDFLKKYKSSLLMAEIAEAIIRGHVKDPQWKTWLMKRMNVTSAILNSQIKQIQKDLNDSLGVLPGDGELFNRYRVFSQMRKEWRFDLCDLNGFEWYTKFFLLLRNCTSSRSVVAHNGIYCGKADFFYHEWAESDNLGTVVLLKDKYRPVVDVARDKIRQIPLEVACDLEILRNQLQIQGFKFNASGDVLDEAHYPYIPTVEYVKLLDNRKDFVERLRFDTNKGNLEATELKELVDQGESVEFKGCPNLKIHRYAGKNEYLYDYLCAAYLCSKFTLQVDISKYDTKVFIGTKKAGEDCVMLNYFSPTFFLLPRSNTPYLVRGSSYNRKTFNASHRMSQFIISNAEQLQRRFPGLFHEMLRTLAEDDASKTITIVNDLLERLKRLPDTGISIPSDLQLSEDDFLGL